MKQMPAKITKVVAWLLPLAVMAGGCASAEKQQAAQRAQDQLVRAQAAYRQAAADPNVQSYAPLRLVDAQKALLAAEQATEVEDIQNLGYVAERKAQTASTLGQAGKLEQETQQLTKETSDILMQKRERELKAARGEAEAQARQAEQARQAAEQARTQAETRTRELEQARAQAEAKTREVEQARAQAEATAREAEQARVQAATAEAQMAAAQAQTVALSKEVTELKGKQTERGVVLTMGDVFFSFGKSDVEPGALRGVDQLAAFLKKYPNQNVLIEGHTDNVGSEETNLALSEKRAEAVKDLLVSKGISPDRIGTKGYGMQNPAVSNDTPAGRQQNRRVDVVILNEGMSPPSSGR